MIAIDTSAIAAIALEEPEAEMFRRAISWQKAIVGAPTLLESHFVLSGRMGASHSSTFVRDFLFPPHIRVVDFTAEMYAAAANAFDRYGKGRGHRAQLNFGDCLAYAVAKAKDVPLLYKGADFAHTDIRSALP